MVNLDRRCHALGAVLPTLAWSLLGLATAPLACDSPRPSHATPAASAVSLQEHPAPLAPAKSSSCQSLKDELELVLCRSILELDRGDPAAVAERFEPGLRRALSTTRLAAVWSEKTAELGDLVAVRPLSTTLARDGSRVQLRAQFSRGERLVEGVVRFSGAIGALAIGPVPQAWTPPPYARPEEFDEREITIGREPALPGRLTVPKHGNTMPAFVFAHGSGLIDEDCSSHISGLGSKLCKDLAWGLSSRGIVVLRFRKRSLVDPRPLVDLDQEVVGDVCAARQLLASLPEVDAERIVLVGHSLGGALAPRIANTCDGFAALVLLSAPARPMLDVLTGQVAYVGWRSGYPELTPDRVEALHAAADRVFLAGADPSEEIDLLGSAAPRSYWRDCLTLEPTKQIARVRRPIFVIQGERDYQVGLADFDRWRKALSGRKDVLFKRYPGLDHVLAEGTGLSSHYDYYLARNVASEVVDDIARWIGTRGWPTSRSRHADAENTRDRPPAL